MEEALAMRDRYTNNHKQLIHVFILTGDEYDVEIEFYFPTMDLRNISKNYETGRGSCSPQESMLDFMTVVISIVQVLLM